jgi:hypothetical protein
MKVVDSMKIDVSKMTPVDEIYRTKKNDNDNLSIYSLAKEAESFLLKQKWCKKILKGYLGLGYEGIICIFYFEIEPSQKNVDKYLWVIVGDLPPAYLVIDQCPNSACALDSYIYEMGLWVQAVKNDKPLDDIIPVNIKPSYEHADMLESRLEFLKNNVLSQHYEDLNVLG